MVSTVLLFQNCGPAKVTSSDPSMNGDLSLPSTGSRVDLNALLKSPQEPSANVLFPAGTAVYDYSNFSPIIETLVLKRNNFDRIDWVHGPTATIVASGDSLTNRQFSSDLLGTYYIFGYRGQTPYFIKQFELVEKTKPTIAADAANALTVSQSQVESDATTETVLVSADAPDVDLKKISFTLKNNNSSISDRRAILVQKKLTESFDVAVSVSDLSGASASKNITLTAKACDFNGSVILNGSGATAYQTSSVPYGQTCTSQTRSCSGGVLNGSYTNSSCTVLPPGACSLDGRTVAHNASITAFETATVPYGQTCVSQSRTCNNGVLSGTYPKAACTPLPPASCTFNTMTVPSGSSVNAFAAASVPYGQTCSSQARTCSNGTLSGTNQFSACSVQPPVNLMNQMAPTTITVARGANLNLNLLITNLKATPTALLGFVHLVPSGSTISSVSIDYEPSRASNTWVTNSSISASPIMAIPATLPVGTYTIRTGFYQRVSPYTRLKMDADDGVTEDGTLRYIVGTVTVK